MKHADLERELAEIGGELSDARRLLVSPRGLLAADDALENAERRLAGLIATLDAEKDMETTK